MKVKEYQQLTRRTNADLGSPQINAAHCTLGIVGEWAEKELALGNDFLLECGDVMWYTSELANIFGIALDDSPSNYPPNLAISKIAESVKKYLAYNKPIVIADLQELLNGIVWDIKYECEQFGYPFEHVLSKNIEKLRKRFPEKFEASLAIQQNDMK